MQRNVLQATTYTSSSKRVQQARQPSARRAPPSLPTGSQGDAGTPSGPFSSEPRAGHVLSQNAALGSQDFSVPDRKVTGLPMEQILNPSKSQDKNRPCHAELIQLPNPTSPISSSYFRAFIFQKIFSHHIHFFPPSSPLGRRFTSSLPEDSSRSQATLCAWPRAPVLTGRVGLQLSPLSRWRR